MKGGAVPGGSAVLNQGRILRQRNSAAMRGGIFDTPAGVHHGGNRDSAQTVRESRDFQLIFCRFGQGGEGSMADPKQFTSGALSQGSGTNPAASVGASPSTSQGRPLPYFVLLAAAAANHVGPAPDRVSAAANGWCAA